MAEKKYPQSDLPIRKTVELLPKVFQTDANDKFMSAVVDPLVQPGVLQKLTGYIGRRYGKTFNGKDIYLDTDQTLRSRYQLEPAVVSKFHNEINEFYDYLDFKNQLIFFGNTEERDDLITSQEHYSWNPPIDWDKFINYREYYWVPEGPPVVPVFGQKASVVSTYKVVLGTGSQSTWIFTPDGLSNNPTLTLYRGQTYKFEVDAPKEGFSIRTNYDTGSLLYSPIRAYPRNSLVIYDNKLWRAKVDVQVGDGSTITPDSQDWEFVENISTGNALDYNQGVTNNGVQNGTLTFKVPYDAPDVLFYQSTIDPNRFGRFIISDIESNTRINVEKEIIGKKNYKSSNEVEFTNGLVVEFRGQVIPEKYASGSWLIEGVGDKISLVEFSNLIVSPLSKEVPEVVFDNEGFDTLPFDNAEAYPAEKDYITISKISSDYNPWSRYNRWFHRSVLEYAFKFRDQDFSANEELRAKRPIIEFLPNIQLFNHGSIAKQVVDYIDDFTDDIFSKIEGNVGYNIDGESLFEGARILVTADKDPLANNRIYSIKFITHNGRNQITLVKTPDSESEINQGVLVRRGNKNAGLMYHFTTVVNDANEKIEKWVLSQRKTKVNQPPLFDIFDEAGVSFSDAEKYPVSSFLGSKILSYREGNGSLDKELGFRLSYLNIDNVGDIQFDWNLEIEKVFYTLEQQGFSVDLKTGYYRFNLENRFDNGWTVLDPKYNQLIVDSTVVQESTNSIVLKTINWKEVSENNVFEITFYKNGKKLESTYTRKNDRFTFDSASFVEGDTVSVKILTDLPPREGYYEIPLGLEKNPLNDDLLSFTLGQAIDHIATAVEFNQNFAGILPGVSNLRDIVDYKPFAKRFIKHSGVVPLAISLLNDKTTNIIKSIQYSRKAYTDFKNNFLEKAISIPFDGSIPDFVDKIIEELTRTKTNVSPFADADMIGCGAYTSIDYEVEDQGIKTFSLSEKFTLTELSRKAVYIYLNGVQLLNQRDYEFNSTFGFVTIKADLIEGDKLQIREYVSTAYCHIPPTPTAMGLYKKYTPMKFVDDTYREPKEVIQGHDGSITIAFDDFRDDLLMELELRIYNNIKEEYDRSIFDIDDVVGGYYGVGIYSKPQLDAVVFQEFLKWIQNTNINYTSNEEYFKETESFTYTYSEMTDSAGKVNLPGWWRGVYQWFYDTDRPHRCPWEMLGFSEKPDWWDEEYGPAPYTRNNLILWEDLRDGIIRQGPRAGTYDRYKRPTLMQHIPTDGDGKLLSPLDSGLAGNYVLINNKGPFVLGDVAPVEYAWRSSSEWPFAVTMAMCLMKPFEFITDSFDRSITSVNQLNQTISKNSKFFIKLKDLADSVLNEKLNSGLVKYLIAYLRSRGESLEAARDKILNLDVNLSSRLSGFVDKAQQKYLLDSKNPRSSSSSIFVPPENYDIIFNVSSPIQSLSYSGVILEKVAGGWVITGYDDIQPYFNYYEAVPYQKDPLISVGGVTETFSDWETNKTYSNGQAIRYRSNFYRAIRSHTSQGNFDESQWKKIPALAQVGGVEALVRRNFNTQFVKKLSYGTKFNTVQQVVDFLLGYEHYLKSVGFKFEKYDPENQVSQDWSTSCKEFMFWTRHNWAVGSLLTLSPAAERVEVTVPVGVTDNILDGFYDYQVLKVDGKPLTPNFLNVNRQFQNIKIETTNTTDGIYFIRLYYVLKEHVVVFSDRTVFNDIIYDKTTGYRQERIKTQGFRTVDWDGDYTSPGFLFDNVNIQTWQPFTDYKLGDIVAYRSFNWTSLENQLGAEIFDEAKWTKLDSKPEKQLVSNFDYKINQFEDYYDADSEGVGEVQRSLARHSIGYQQRNYLQNLAEDPVTQFQIYQGFIREKGTSNAVTKVFNKLSRSGDESVTLNEEWAFRIGRFGGLDQLKEIEFEVRKDKFIINPQPILFENTTSQTVRDQYYRIGKPDFTLNSNPFSFNINSEVTEDPIRTAGYVKLDQINYIVKNRDDILNIDIRGVIENDNIWITFDDFKWNVLRYNKSSTLAITTASKQSDRVTLEFNRPHNLLVDEIIGITDITNLVGFYKITEVVSNLSVKIEVDISSQDPEIDSSSLFFVGILTKSRFESYDTLDQRTAALLRTGSKLWIDDNSQGSWEVIEKQKQYDDKLITEYGIIDPVNTGTKVIYNDKQRQVITSIPGSGFVMVYVETPQGLIIKQIISPPSGYENKLLNSFGAELAISPDARWLIVGTPLGSGIPSNYKGEFNPSANYITDDIVLENGQLWKAKVDIYGDGSTITVQSEDWEPALVIPSYLSARDPGFTEQGFITIYEWSNQRWEIKESIVSPRPARSEKFGSSIAISQNGTGYTMAVSAPGSLGDLGRVYLYTYVPNETLTQTFNGASAVDLINNVIVFDEPHGYYSGQPVTYLNGTLNGAEKSTADQPPPPADYTKFFVIRFDQTKIRLAATIQDVVNEIPLNLRDIGIDDSSFHTLVRDARQTGWQHIENTNYRGIYSSSPSAIYPVGAIVWYDSSLWEAIEETVGSAGVPTLGSAVWRKLNPVSTQCSLPQNISVDDDGSTLALGILNENQLAELIKGGDGFGHSVAMNRDGSVIAIGAPNSDGQYFAKYRGIWRPDVEYREGDVVKYDNYYFRLADNRIGQVEDSTVISYGEEPGYETNPDDGAIWQNVGDSSLEPSGKVYIYQKSEYGTYELKQTIASGSLVDISDLDGETINTGDQFGWSLDFDYSGTTLVVTSPRADINLQNQGSAYIFRTDGFANLEYRLKQKLESFETYPNEYFGQAVSISPDGDKIAIGAKNASFTNVTRFEAGVRFDQGRTTFAELRGFAGAVYVFDRKADTYFLTEKLETELSPFESFGSSVDCSSSSIVVGSPNFVPGTIINDLVVYSGHPVGMVRLFTKIDSVDSWKILSTKETLVDITKIKSISLYDQENNRKIQDLDYVDNAKLKILNSAEEEITYKTLYDPAVYSIGTDEQTVEPTQAWDNKKVGQLWWNLSTAKWIYYEQGDVAYRTGNWNRLAEGSTIDVYEWVESVLLPSEWSALADTNEGIVEGISGQPLYPNDDVYVKKELFNPNTGEATSTLYYYWVRNKTVVPANVPGRTRSAAEVANLINNPAGSGTAFVSLIAKDKILAFNFDSILSVNKAYINIQYFKDETEVNPVHSEYELLTEGVPDSVPCVKLENKWLDSLIGVDQAGNTVPDPDLLAKQKYGIEYRPRQSMFVDRIAALKLTIDNINRVLQKEPFADIINFTNLNLVDGAPDSILNTYDIAVDTFSDLNNVGTSRIRPAKLSVNLINGEVDTIDILDTGFGYKNNPMIEFEGDGVGAKARAIKDTQGRITSVEIISRGKKYSSIVAKIRSFSVLVRQDSTARNFWSIYSWDESRRSFFRTKTQAFDTTRYWSYADWWKEGFTFKDRVIAEIIDLYEEPKIITEVGDLIRVKEYTNGGWAVFRKISNSGVTFSDRYEMVGRQNGTIAISSDFYNTSNVGIGYDNTQTFDITGYDIGNNIELRNIFRAIKEDVFIGDYSVEWNKLFFSGIRFAFAEQQYIDWAFKTSFLNAKHNVGNLEQKVNYKNDSLESFQQFINEVKPFRTTVREYISRYDGVDISNSAVADFDLPPVYLPSEGRIVPVSNSLPLIDQYPWKWWTDNQGYSIDEIRIYDTGTGYTDAPRVVIDGNGIGAEAIAYISNGSVVDVRVIRKGSGYTGPVKITLVGGNGANNRVAKAVAIVKDTKIRSFNLSIKFDRISKEGIYDSFTQEQTFTADGFTSVFELNYAPTRDKSKITVFRNSQIVLSDEYEIELYQSPNQQYTLLRGRLKFNELPEKGTSISIVYEKNDQLLDSVNRIQKYYSPALGMKGKDIGQLMTGIDFGGVQIQGTTFDVTGGWDALPWFTDNWDSVESADDFYVVCDGSTTSVTLPFVPAPNQEINIYLKRAGSNEPLRSTKNILTNENTNEVFYDGGATTTESIVRIDDPNFNPALDSSTATNPNAQMPTFIGDGSTTVIEIGKFLSTNAGDTLIFRKSTSDGSVTIKDTNLLDTQISGGSLSAIGGAYVTATGIQAEDIVIDGDSFVSPDQVPAPEENVPGQVLDSVSIKVYNSVPSGAAPLQSKTIISDGTQRRFDIGLRIIEENSVLVYVDKIRQLYKSTASFVGKISGTTLTVTSEEVQGDLLPGMVISGSNVIFGTKIVSGSGNTWTVDISQATPANQNVELFGEYSDYVIDFETNQVEFITAPTVGSYIEIISFGVGGIALLDYKEFRADGETSLFVTGAQYSLTSSVYVTVNGKEIDVQFLNSSDLTTTDNKTLVQFGTRPALGEIVKIVCLGQSLDTDSSGISIVKVNQQTIVHDGSTRSYDLDEFVNLSRSSATTSMIVELNNVALRGPDLTYAIYDGTNNQFNIATDPEEPAGAVLISDIAVFINGERQVPIRDFLFNGPAKQLTINADILNLDDVIQIENSYRSEYIAQNNNIVIRNNVTLNEGDIINVTWFSEYPTMGITSDEYSGGKIHYKVSQPPLNSEYVWVYKNGNRLTKDQDYRVDVSRSLVYLKENTLNSDLIKIVAFGSTVWQLPSAYEIHKDMLNVYHYKRYVIGDIVLAKDLNYYDQQMTVNDASGLYDPVISRNISGVIYVNGERIEYLRKDGNVLSQLRRGSFGTTIPLTHVAGSKLVDVGPGETLPYAEKQDKLDFISDGSTLLIGPLDFVAEPRKNNRGQTVPFTYRSTIPSDYYPCDTVEVFVGGKRLRKDPETVYAEAEGSSSPQADIRIEAEFSVKGDDAYIRLTEPVPIGHRITVVRRTGQTWYDRGRTTASAGKTLLENSTAIATFIAQKTTNLPE